MKYFIKINDTAQPMMTRNRLLFDMLTGEEQPQDMGGLLLALVLAIHLAGFYFVNANTPVTEAKPEVIMEVSMVAVPLPVADVPPPAPTPPAPPEPPKPVPPKPVKPKPVTKAKPVVKPVVHKTEPVFIPVAKDPAPVPISNPAPVAAPAKASTAKAAPAPSKPQTFTQAAVGANYGYNPKPKYPSVARSRGWEGKVILRVQVSADGEAEQVSVVQSSGHDVLDDAAVAAVEGWRFVPAKRGDTPVASAVNVPINFKLD